MGKLKTRSAAKKRFTITKSGKVMRRHAKMRHLLECKSAKKKRGLRRGQVVARADVARIKAMLAGG
jgi:large subunit ribosomal protein L35